MSDERERVVLFGTLALGGCALVASGVPAAKAFLLCVLGLVAALFLNPYQRWRHRHLPGPPYRPLVGNLPEIITRGSHAFFDECRDLYGTVFVVWFGARPWVVVADAELGRRVNFRLVNRPFAFANPLARGEALHAAREGLFLARDGQWSLLRRVWQPAFHADALARYAPVMAAEARGLVRRLERAAAAGGGVTNVWRDIGAMTMSVVGSTAYGVDFRLLGSGGGGGGGGGNGGGGNGGGSEDASSESSGSVIISSSSSASSSDDLDDDDGDDGRASPDDDVRPGADATGGRRDHHHHRHRHHHHHNRRKRPLCNKEDARKGAALVQAAADMFSASEISNATRYLVAAHLMPPLVPAIRLLASAFPDERYRRLVTARDTLRLCSLALIDETRAAQALAAASGDPHAGAAAKKLGGPGAAAAAPRAVAPGSFLGLLLAARDHDGHALTDRQMAAQCNVFTLAGYETTSNALSYAIYCLAARPEAERRLREELDALPGAPGREVSVEDLPRLPYAAAVVDEALRLFPPGASTMRESKGGLELAGRRVPDGTTVMVATYTIQRDPLYWPKAREFLPERWLPGGEHLAPSTPNAYLPFGSGARMCIGHRFALQEARLTLAALYRRFAFELAPGQVPLRVKTGITMSPEDGVWVRVVPRVANVGASVGGANGAEAVAAGGSI